MGFGWFELAMGCRSSVTPPKMSTGAAVFLKRWTAHRIRACRENAARYA